MASVNRSSHVSASAPSRIYHRQAETSLWKFTLPHVILAISCAIIPGSYETAAETNRSEHRFFQWAQTPPMGWNSYDCYSYKINEKQVRDNFDYMAAPLRQLGWQYVVVDYVWSEPCLPGNRYAPEQSPSFEQRLNMDGFGRLLPDKTRFPSTAVGKGFKPLANHFHAKGLK